MSKSALRDGAKTIRTGNIDTPRTALRKEEEDWIVAFLLRSSNTGIPLTRSHLKETAFIVIKSLPVRRCKNLRFRNGRPGSQWIGSFYNRHKNKIVLPVPYMQESFRLPSTAPSHLKGTASILKH